MKNAGLSASDLHERGSSGCGVIFRLDLAVFAEIGKLPPVTTLILHVKRDAGINRARIDMNTDCALRIVAEVVETMDRLKFIRRQHWAAGAGLDFTCYLKLRMF